MVGLNYNGLHPTGGTGRNCKENLKVMKTLFGATGWILGGSHRSLKCSTHQFSASAAQIRVARLQIVPEVLIENIDAKVEKDFHDLKVAKLSIEPQLSPEYWDKDNLGVEPPRRCTTCRQCADKGECSEKHVLHTLEEEIEKKAIEDNVQVVDGKVQVKYPFKEIPAAYLTTEELF